MRMVSRGAEKVGEIQFFTRTYASVLWARQKAEVGKFLSASQSIDQERPRHAKGRGEGNRMSSGGEGAHQIREHEARTCFIVRGVIWR